MAKATEQRADEDDEVLDLTGTAGVSDGSGSTAWHVMGTCDDEQAARVRVRWAERMWSEVQTEVMRPKQALDMGVALAVQRLWSVEGGGGRGQGGG